MISISKLISCGIFSVVLMCCSIEMSFAQTFAVDLENPISTSFSFLSSTPNAGVNAMGEAGTAVINNGALYTNAAAISALPDSFGLALDYKRGAGNLLCLSVYNQYTSSALAFGLRYNSLGGSTLITPTGNINQGASNYELAFDVAGSHSFSSHFMTAITGKVFYSTISKDMIINGVVIKPSSGIAADISCLYTTTVNGTDKINIGATISNIGSPQEYGYPGYDYFIPTTLSIGFAYDVRFDDNNQLVFALDVNKLIVPTIYNRSESAAYGMLHSFNDAPGGVQEEMHEITFGAGIDYSYQEKVHLRAGYFYEHPSKGGRTYFSLGGGIAIGNGNLDVAYRFYDNTQAIVVANALSLTLSVNL